ncbi:MAG: Rieske 2Fe-2S domain-containing protein [Ardenticatenales bacterium]|nr:Rieske 2Fe-2S domain-containing protein [Ardenticatenales bacterium]
MITEYAERWIKQIPGLHEAGMALSLAMHRAVLNGGDSVRSGTDFLHGTWLGHPLHPVLTDIPIGSWSLAMLFDGIAANTDSEHAEWTADALTTVGVLAAVPTALTGAADYSTIPEHATASGTLHALLNSSALVLYLLSIRERKSGSRELAVLFSSIAFGIMTFSAWVGGTLVYKERVGVRHGQEPSEPETWTTVMDASELREQGPTRVEVEGTPVLLYRYEGTVYAMAAVCRHAGGPLEKGTFEGHCVQCPWHDSVFDLRDGTVVHGPSTYPQPSYATRIHEGNIEVRLEQPAPFEDN